jgi:hypothetical protein
MMAISKPIFTQIEYQQFPHPLSEYARCLTDWDLPAKITCF